MKIHHHGFWITLEEVDSGLHTMDSGFHALDCAFQNLKFCWIPGSFTSGDYEELIRVHGTT